MKTVMMTGATGFVGGVLADKLLDDGYDLKLLARTPSKASDLADRGAEIIEGDLTDPDSIERALEGVDGVFHLAAVYTLGGDLDWMRQVNVDGTRKILEAAEKRDLRVLYCGSDTSLGDTNGEICDESTTHDGNFRSNYARTKYEAHQLVDDRMDDGQEIVHAIVSSVYGPGDESPIAGLIQNHLAGHALAYLDGDAGYTFTHVDDVAEALKRAYETGNAGESYLVSGEPLTFEEFFAELSGKTGIPEPKFEIPDWIADTVASIGGLMKSITGRTGAELKEMIEMGRNVTRFFSSDKAKRELDWTPRSISDGLKDTIPDFGRKELEEARRLLSKASYPLLGLAAFDLVLGSTAAFLPGLYRKIIHPDFIEMYQNGPTYLITRTGVLWLVFAGV
ncbi:MAG: NAD-dependent epimerase/dehydratase family protein, partial [bacterium]